MNRKAKLIVLCIGFLFSSMVAFAQVDRDRGFLFQIGLGFAGVSYPSDVELLLDALESIPGVSRTRLNLHLGAGYTITPNLYGSFLIDGYADRLDDNIDYLQVNSYLFGFGVIGYPFTTGLVLGAHAGPARQVVDTNFAGSATSSMGFGLSLMAGYDFARRLTGPSLMIGLRFGGATIEDDSIGFATFFGSFLFK